MKAALFPEIVVNGTTLSAADIAAEAQNHPAPEGKPGLAWRKAARALAIRQLLLDRADTMAIEATPQELAPGRIETADEARIREVLERLVTPEPVSEPELRAVYDRDPGAFRAPTLYQASHVLYAADPHDEIAREDARARALAALDALTRAPGRFGDIARAESDCSSRGTDGQLGQLTSGDTVPEFEAAMREATPGAIHHKPVETRYGVHVLRLDDRAEGEILPFETIRPRLAEACEKANWTRAAHAFVSALLEGAEIEGLDPKFTG